VLRDAAEKISGKQKKKRQTGLALWLAMWIIRLLLMERESHVAGVIGWSLPAPLFHKTSLRVTL
jgi:hypothetical protein